MTRKPSTPQTSVAAAVASGAAAYLPPTSPLTFDEFLARLPAKDRASAEKRLAAIDAVAPARGKLWRQLAASLLTLSGHSAKVNPSESIQFYTADGKYRMQIFALQDNQPGELTIHCRDVIDTLVEKKMLRKSKNPDAPHRYAVAGTEDAIVVERVLPQSAEHPPAFRDLLSWNRKCMRIDLPDSATGALLDKLADILKVSLPAAKK